MRIKDVVPEKYHENIANAIYVISKMQAEISSQFKIPMEVFENYLKKNQKLINEIIDLKTNLNKTINLIIQDPKFQTFFWNFKKIIDKYVDEYPKHVRIYILKLANHGWFLDFKRINISFVFNYVKYLEKDTDAVNNELCNQYKKQLDNILDDLINRYPKRKTIFTKAFQAHKNGDYELSIPTLFAQIDGACKEEIGKEFFLPSKSKDKKLNNKPQTVEFFNDYRFNSIIDSLLEPLKVKTSINASENVRKKLNYITLNRHEVLHGESTIYATEINSFKVISLLSYINSIFSELNIKDK